jgi:hypothetical protein
VAGACVPENPDYIYTTTELDAGWYDTNAASLDGPAAVFRVVLDVSGVTGADTSGGLGSVYFSTDGPSDPGPIEVASMHAKAGRKFAGATLTMLEGAFYVTD